jgi:hypothetical protein
VQAVQGGSTATQLRLGAPANTYGNWTWQAYSLGAAVAATSRTADPDGDGLANLAEYAWKLNPAARDGAQTAVAANGDASVSFTFKAPKNAPDVTVIAECSSDLKTWFPAPSSIIASDADFDTRVSTAAPGQRCFWRVRFEPITQ